MLTNAEMFLGRLAGTLFCLGFLYAIGALAIERMAGYELPPEPLVGLFLGGITASCLWGLQLFWIM